MSYNYVPLLVASVCELKTQTDPNCKIRKVKAGHKYTRKVNLWYRTRDDKISQDSSYASAHRWRHSIMYGFSRSNWHSRHHCRPLLAKYSLHW